jgi:hypothetical protein
LGVIQLCNSAVETFLGQDISVLQELLSEYQIIKHAFKTSGSVAVISVFMPDACR